VVASGATLNVPRVVGTQGLLEILLDGSSGTDMGSFQVNVQWFTGDPNTCSNCQIDNPAQTIGLAAYSATNIPEPGTFTLAAVGLILALRRAAATSGWPIRRNGN
jgi:PEP-CTERM motif